MHAQSACGALLCCGRDVVVSDDGAAAEMIASAAAAAACCSPSELKITLHHKTGRTERRMGGVFFLLFSASLAHYPASFQPNLIYSLPDSLSTVHCSCVPNHMRPAVCLLCVALISTWVALSQMVRCCFVLKRQCFF